MTEYDISVEYRVTSHQDLIFRKAGSGLRFVLFPKKKIVNGYSDEVTFFQSRRLENDLEQQNKTKQKTINVFVLFLKTFSRKNVLLYSDMSFRKNVPSKICQIINKQ